MAHIKVAAGKGPNVPLDGFTIHAGEQLNVDVTLPVTAARIADGTLIQVDSAALPPTPRMGFGVAVINGAITDASFEAPPPVGTVAFRSDTHQMVVKESANPSVWRTSPAYV